MAITFPASPTNGQIFTSGNKSWIWDGVTWLAYGASLSPTVLKVDTTNSRVGINNQSPAYALDVNGTVEATQFLQGTDYLSPYQGFRNKIINGDMRVDQRGTASTPKTTNDYITDRWYNENGCNAVLSAQQSTDVPTGQGFAKSLKVTSTTADASIGATQFAVVTQHIEGHNFAHLAFGSASAKQIVVSFWIKATVTGTYSFTLYNNGASRILPTAFTVSASNTWEKKTVVITGDTSGTWLTDTNRGVSVNFYTALGSSYLGTSGVWNGSNIYGVTGQANAWSSINNVFAITGVQLEEGSVATPFEQRPIGTELALCQRYYERISGVSTSSVDWANIGSGGWDSTTVFSCTYNYFVPKRARPSIFSSATGVLCLYHGIAWQTVTGVNSYTEISSRAARINYQCSGTSVQGQAGIAVLASSTAYIEISSEL